MGSRTKAQRPMPVLQKKKAPVAENDPNIQLAAQYEEDRLRRREGAQQNRLISSTQRASSGNLLLSQTGTRQ